MADDTEILVNAAMQVPMYPRRHRRKSPAAMSSDPTASAIRRSRICKSRRSRKEYAHTLGLPRINEISPTVMDTNCPPKVTIYLGSQRQQVLQSSFLSHVWGGGLDTPCMECNKDFDSLSGPPIRTISFEAAQNAQCTAHSITEIPLTPNPIRIRNRHSQCIKEKGLSYVPISHAWHQAVSDAHGSHREDLEAARLVYQIPVRTLAAAAAEYGMDTEIWHDYLSVPQWQTEVQERLILALPNIFINPSHILMHLDDISFQCLHDLSRSTSYLKLFEALTLFFNSRWFGRMWVCLEYVLSREVFILTQDYKISHQKSTWYVGRVEKCVASIIDEYGHDQFNEKALELGFPWPIYRSWTDMERWKNQDVHFRTLGDAVYIIGNKKCRQHRDRFLALKGFLNPGEHNYDTAPILQNALEACLSVSWQALENGDYTPLLFTPDQSESRIPHAPWLNGHTMMSEDLWDLGMMHRRPLSQTIIRDGKVMPELESVGVIEEHEYFSFAGNQTEVFHKVASKILQSSGICPKKFGDAIDRIFVRIEKKGRYSEDKSRQDLPATSESPSSVDSYDFLQLGVLLNDYSRCIYGRERDKSLKIATLIFDLMRLDRLEDEAGLSRLSLAAKEAAWYGANMEGLARISCKTCSQRSLFRLVAWETPKSFAQLYRIPGLLYEETIPEGVGLVIDGKRIIGKMQYGTPACNCHKSELVEIGSARIPNSYRRTNT